MIRWQADQALATLIRRYYHGEAALWPVIRDQIDQQLRERGLVTGEYHIRLRPTDNGYDIQIDSATGYRIEP